ncbi:MAG TPA: MFS transporter, partial [Actinomycetota bacterium]|nr:MFS transporter [Actinomycetota bacterium]
QLVTRFGYKYVMAIGLLLAAGGLFLLTRISPTGSFTVDVLPAMLIVAFGLGMTFVPLQIASVTGVAPAEIGLASGLVNAFLQVGGAIGLAVLSTISTSEFNSVIGGLHGHLAVPTALVDGFQRAFLAGGILLAAGALLVLFLLPQGGYRGSEQTAEDEKMEAVPA